MLNKAYIPEVMPIGLHCVIGYLKNCVLFIYSKCVLYVSVKLLWCACGGWEQPYGGCWSGLSPSVMWVLKTELGHQTW